MIKKNAMMSQMMGLDANLDVQVKQLVGVVFLSRVEYPHAILFVETEE